MRSAISCIMLLNTFIHTADCQELDSIPDEIPEFEYYDNFSLSTEFDCATQASQDIKGGDPRLIICFNRSQDGVSPGTYYSNQQEFESQYGIKYKLYTCTSDNEKCIKKYNRQVAKHLSKIFGSKWKEEVRKDVYGIR